MSETARRAGGVTVGTVRRVGGLAAGGSPQPVGLGVPPAGAEPE